MAEKKKYKILTISDHPLVSSGVGTQTRYIIEGLLRTDKYQVRSFGGAIKQQDYRPQRVNPYGDDWIIFPIDGYGNEHLVREFMDAEKPDAIWFMTDPRFYIWLFNMSDEIRDRNIPLLYYHVWDNYPVPDFNKQFYDSCDYVGCISQLTHDILQQLDHPDSEYIPHAVNPDVFKPVTVQKKNKIREEMFKEHRDKFIFFYNSRNARRKMTSDVVKVFKQFVDKVGEDKAFLFMHTDPHDREGANLVLVAEMLGLNPSQLAFSSDRIPPELMANYYQASDVTINISNNEGFGLSCLESLSCGTPVIINRTGGLQDQATTDDGTELGVVIEPSSTSLTGSQEIPYIIDDRCSDEDILNAMLKMYKMSKTDRKELGKKARAWVEKRFRIDAMINTWDSAIERNITKYKEHGNKNRIRFERA